MKKSLVWLRRDIRLIDHTAISAACAESDEVHLVFVFDPNILTKLPSEDKRVTFIMEALIELNTELKQEGSGINILYGDPKTEIPDFAHKLGVNKLFFNRDYEPYALKRDKSVSETLKKNDIEVASFRDHVIFEHQEIVKKDRSPYKVFTPYKRAWYAQFFKEFTRAKKFNLKNGKFATRIYSPMDKVDWYKKINFIKQDLVTPTGRSGGIQTLNNFKKRVSTYHETRNLLEATSTSGLSPYLRHGLISTREILNLGLENNKIKHETFVSEIVWREFYQMILMHFPHIEKGSFKPQYDEIIWAGGKKEFDAWKSGNTGYPIVDAAMRCLNETGLMPNRLRMVTASFLCKTLLVDWRKGEKYFAEKLLDFDLGANNGGWQWSSSSGCDSQPYFRIFNPLSQSEKFDPQGAFIRRWCPEIAALDNKQIHQPHAYGPLFLIEKGIDYPAPVVNYSLKRMEALAMYKKALK